MMTKGQYEIVKWFLEVWKTPPKKLVKEWAKYGTKLDLVEVCRVYFCDRYEVYKNDTIPGEDVLLAMFGNKK